MKNKDRKTFAEGNKLGGPGPRAKENKHPIHKIY